MGLKIWMAQRRNHRCHLRAELFAWTAFLAGSPGYLAVLLNGYFSGSGERGEGSFLPNIPLSLLVHNVPVNYSQGSWDMAFSQEPLCSMQRGERGFFVSCFAKKLCVRPFCFFHFPNTGFGLSRLLLGTVYFRAACSLRSHKSALPVCYNIVTHLKKKIWAVDILR